MITPVGNRTFLSSSGQADLTGIHFSVPGPVGNPRYASGQADTVS